MLLACPHLGFFHVPAKSDPESTAQFPALFFPSSEPGLGKSSTARFMAREAPDPCGDGSQGRSTHQDQLPPHQHQGHAAVFAPLVRRNSSFLGSNADCRTAGEIPAPQPSARKGGAAQCGLSPSLMDAAGGEEGLAISPRAMGRCRTGSPLI